VNPCTSDSSLSGFIQIRILKNDLRCLSPQLKENRLQMLTGKFGYDGSDRSRPGEIDFPGCGVGDELFDDSRGIFTTVLNDIENTRREPSVFEQLANEVVGCGTQFRGFQSGR
jgi:hypothetical protein